MADFRTWRMDFDTTGNTEKRNLDPPGFDIALAKDYAVASGAGKKKDASIRQRKQQALFAKATAPFKQVAFMCFMAWMFGNGIQIFSIMMTVGLIATPLTAILNCAEAFPRDEESNLDVFFPRVLYCLIQSGQFIFGLYKLHSMGLLPVYPSDWISAMGAPESKEYAFGAVSVVP